MNVHSMFPSKYVAASDLGGQDAPVIIGGIRIEKVGSEEEQRPVIYFQGFTKGMVLNRTNAKRIAELYGADTDKWVGRPISLYPSETEYAGDTVPCIRVRKEAPMLSTLPQQPQAVVAPPITDQPRIPADALVAAGNGSKPRW